MKILEAWATIEVCSKCKCVLLINKNDLRRVEKEIEHHVFYRYFIYNCPSCKHECKLTTIIPIKVQEEFYKDNE